MRSQPGRRYLQWCCARWHQSGFSNASPACLAHAPPSNRAAFRQNVISDMTDPVARSISQDIVMNHDHQSSGNNIVHKKPAVTVVPAVLRKMVPIWVCFMLKQAVYRMRRPQTARHPTKGLDTISDQVARVMSRAISEDIVQPVEENAKQPSGEDIVDKEPASCHSSGSLRHGANAAVPHAPTRRPSHAPPSKNPAAFCQNVISDMTDQNCSRSAPATTKKEKRRHFPFAVLAVLIQMISSAIGPFHLSTPDDNAADDESPPLPPPWSTNVFTAVAPTVVVSVVCSTGSLDATGPPPRRPRLTCARRGGARSACESGIPARRGGQSDALQHYCARRV